MIGAIGDHAKRIGQKSAPIIVRGIVFLKMKRNVVKLMNLELNLERKIARKANAKVRNFLWLKLAWDSFDKNASFVKFSLSFGLLAFGFHFISIHFYMKTFQLYKSKFNNKPIYKK